MNDVVNFILFGAGFFYFLESIKLGLQFFKFGITLIHLRLVLKMY